MREYKACTTGPEHLHTVEEITRADGPVIRCLDCQQILWAWRDRGYEDEKREPLCELSFNA